MNEISEVVVVNDIHLGWEKANTDDFLEFISNEIYKIDPDTFIINGDLLELWRSSFGSIMVNYGDIFSSLRKIEESDIDVVLIAGNHDWRMMETRRDRISESQSLWEFRQNYKFDSGDREFIATHGHEADSINRSNSANGAMCMTSSDLGELMSDTWEFIIDTPILDSAIKRRPFFRPSTRDVPLRDGPLMNRPNLKIASHINNPGALAEDENRGRYNRVLKILEKMYDRTVLAGHTHVKEELDWYYNPGAWVGSENRYTHVVDGDVSIELY